MCVASVCVHPFIKTSLKLSLVLFSVPSSKEEKEGRKNIMVGIIMQDLNFVLVADYCTY